jgi:riboflavin kinase / FMN adenylyltransferase
MIIIEDNFNIKLDYKTYIALGSFDGLHMGHMGLINKTIELSKQNNVKSMVCTFKNHPLSIINKDKAPKLIMDNETKLKLLENAEIDIVNLVNFDYDYMKISAEDFIVNMVNHYNVQGFIVGFNYRFGYKNSGDIELLKRYSLILGFELHVIDSVTYESEVVSSSRIRSLILDGKVSDVNNMLLTPFMLKGTVISGKQLGRKLGFPTANLKYDEGFILPKNGVYYTVVEYKNSLYKGMTSVGVNPTVQSKTNTIFIETYILDFEKNIYGEELKLFFIKRMRDEVKFNSLDGLIYQLRNDKIFVKKQEIENFASIC